ncbi:MAG: ParA family protein [Planctomycetia bacterium]|nr:ParA family protein [Planctomycetia bacterium]
MFTLAIANQKGGVGKTTTAVNIAHLLAVRGLRVLLLDMDPQGNATSGLGVEVPRELTSRHFLLDEASAIRRWLIETRWQNLVAIPGNPRMVGLERAANPWLGLSEALGTVADRFDYTIIDCPPSLGVLTRNALAGADAVLVPVQCEYYPMEGLVSLLDLVEMVQEAAHARVFIAGILLTMFDAEVAISGEVEVEIRQHFDDKTFETLIPRDAALAEAPSHGMPVFEYAPRSVGAAAYLRATTELLKRIS